MNKSQRDRFFPSPFLTWFHPGSESPAVSTLRCITCYLRTPSDHCRRGYGFCTAEQDAKCMMLTIYRQGIPELFYTDCQRFCRDLIYRFNNRTYVHNCCDFDYCNFKF
ncbi:prostate and testis expressed protein 3 [Erinaceus europaeus]|uniref:Prostate and testis expressed protein 3 n=1 Tax=Erinaceus europaeus TaxID=9365 RepID=A0ABM3WGQ4_ERIEU|nr:prostate and testis expressed protein 3 [Erinaceus europaeus]